MLRLGGDPQLDSAWIRSAQRVALRLPAVAVARMGLKHRRTGGAGGRISLGFELPRLLVRFGRVGFWEANHAGSRVSKHRGCVCPAHRGSTERHGAAQRRGRGGSGSPGDNITQSLKCYLESSLNRAHF